MKPVKSVWLIFSLVIGVLICYKASDYFSPDFNEGFLLHKQPIFGFYQYFLYAHIIGAPIALFSGILQLSFGHLSIHRLVGKIYLSSIFLLAAPGAFGMAWFALGNSWSVVNFLLMSVLWVYFSWTAYASIIKRNVDLHKTMMYRSFILTSSAISQRILLFINHQFGLLDYENGYILISWLSWLPLLLIHELLLLKRKALL